MEKRKESNKYGIIAENLFINRCIQNNLSVFKNQNSIGEIDFIVLIEKKLVKVQVKSTMEPVKNNTYYVSTKRNKNRLYTDIDYVACFLHTANEWYIIPFSSIQDKQAVTITLSDNRYIEFKENWKFNIEKTAPQIDDHNVSLRNKSIELFKKGISKSEISRQLDVHYGTINRWLRDAGFGIRTLKVSKDELKKQYNLGKTMKEVATELNITVWTTRKLFREYGIPVRTDPYHKSNKIKEL